MIVFPEMFMFCFVPVDLKNAHVNFEDCFASVSNCR